MPQVFVHPHDIQPPSFIVRSDEAHHLIQVLRAKENDPIHFFDGEGQQYAGVIDRIDKKNRLVQGHILQVLPSQEKLLKVHLFQGLPKGSKFDYVIEKAVELGVDVIVPFLSRKNIVRLDDKQAETKLRRWQSLVLAASKQSGRSRVPRMEKPAEIYKFEPRFQRELTIVLSPQAGSINLKEFLKTHPVQGGIVNVLIGPEAGWDEGELLWLKKCGAKPVKLGEAILRTETAGLAFLAIFNYEMGLI